MDRKAEDRGARVPDAAPAPSPRVREPALDGLRAVAVLAVVAFHAEATWARGGFLGVDVFFVLSGFLITRLLLQERATAGRIDLGAFWVRRMRRLLPALLVLLASLLVLGLVMDLPTASMRALPGDALAALLSVANWRFLATDQGYFAASQSPSLLEHAWSLSIEEQFYLLWAPLLAGLALVGTRLARRRRWSTRRVVLAVAVVGAAASAAWMGFRHVSSPADSPVAYWDTLGRLQGPLIGAALAVVLTSGRARRLATGRRGLPTAVAAAGLAGVLVMVVVVDDRSGLLYPGGFLLAALATAAVIAGVHLHPDGAVATALGWRPIAALGLISYGVYLWHWPMLFLVTGARTGITGIWIHLLRLALTIGAATASYVLIERRVRRSRAGFRPTVATFATVGAVVVLALVIAVPSPTNDQVDTALAIPDAEAFLAPSGAASAAPDGNGVGVASTTSPSADLSAHTRHTDLAESLDELLTAPTPTTETAREAAPPPAPTTIPPPTAPSTVPGPPVRITVFGDSVADSLAQALAPEAARFNTQVLDAGVVGCGVPTVGPYRLGNDEHDIATECVELPDVWAARLDAERPDVAVFVLGRHEVLDRVYDDNWTAIGDPGYDGYLASQLTDVVEHARQDGITVVLTTAPFYVGPEAPGGGIRPENAPARVHRFNQIVADVASADPGVHVVDLGGLVSPGGTYAGVIDGVRIRNDGVHFAPEAGAWLAPRLLPELVGTVR